MQSSASRRCRSALMIISPGDFCKLDFKGAKLAIQVLLNRLLSSFDFAGTLRTWIL